MYSTKKKEVYSYHKDNDIYKKSVEYGSNESLNNRNTICSLFANIDCSGLMTGKKQYAYNIAGNASSSQGKHGYSCDTKKELANGDAPSEPYEDEKPSTQLSSTTSQVMQATSTIVASQNRLG